MKNLKSLVSTPTLTQWRTQVASHITPGWAEFLLTLLVLLFLQW